MDILIQAPRVFRVVGLGEKLPDPVQRWPVY